MPITQYIKTWKGVTSTPFAGVGAQESKHVRVSPDRSMIYPSNARTLASSKFSAYPITGKRGLQVSVLGNHSNEAALLSDSQIYYFNPNLQTSSSVASVFTSPSNTMFFEFDGGLYYSRDNTLVVYRQDLQTGTNSIVGSGSISPQNYINGYGGRITSLGTGFIVANSTSGSVAYTILPNIPSKPSNNTSATLGFRIPGQCVSVDEYKNYAAIMVTKGNGGAVVFWDGKSAGAAFIEDLPQGRPLFVRSVAGNLIAVSLDYNVNDVTLIFSVYDGGNFVPVYKYTKYNPTSKVVNIQDSSAQADDGVLYFSGDFCGESGLWSFSMEESDLRLISYHNNSELSPAFTSTNYCLLPSQWGITGGDADAFLYQNTNNDYNSVSPKYATERFDANFKPAKKKWLSVGISTHTDFDENGSTPSVKQIDIYYRTDNNTTWNLLGTHIASSEPFTELTYENTQITITDYHTIQFRLIWTGLTYADEFYVKHDILPQIGI